MIRYIYLQLFASNYGEGAYGGCDYSSGCGEGGLSNTGLTLAIVATAACLIALVALLVRFARRRNGATYKAAAKRKDAETE